MDRESTDRRGATRVGSSKLRVACQFDVRDGQNQQRSPTRQHVRNQIVHSITRRPFGVQPLCFRLEDLLLSQAYQQRQQGILHSTLRQRDFIDCPAVKMGCSTSKTAARNSTNSTTPLNIEVRSPAQANFPRSPGVHDLNTFDPQQDRHEANEIVVTSFAGDDPESGITHPKPARPLKRRYSELLDPKQLEDKTIRSPSGNLLSRSTYNLRDDRPLSVRERQEIIRLKLMQEKKAAEVVEVNEVKRNSVKLPDKRGLGEKNEKRGGCLGCFGA